MRTWPIAPFLLSAQIILWFQSRMGPNHRGQAADNEVLLLHDNRWKNKGSEKVSLPHGSSSIRPPSTTEELFSLQEEDGEPGNLTSLLFLLRINCDGLITIMKDFSPHFATGYSIHILFDTIVYTFTRHQRATEVFFFNSACCIKFY
ncbi:uncharacterized protein isoform X11 [Danio rerio]|uniref:Uncharacterized protein isoform X11 n=1 Tax=Danio rerio TaxID=7955 RepID=A0AC58GGJ6_DANRE